MKTNYSKTFCVSLFIATIFLSATGGFAQASKIGSNNLSAEKNSEIQKILQYYDKQIYFTENKGQWPDHVLYRADFRLGQALVTRQGMIVGTFDASSIATLNAQIMAGEKAKQNGQQSLPPNAPIKGHGWLMNFVNSSPAMTIESRTKHPDVFNYLQGDASKNAMGANNYQEIWYNNVYANVDVRYYPSKEGTLEYDIVCKPGFNKNNIALKLDGIDEMRVTKKGHLILSTSVGDMEFPAPVAYQKINGQRKAVQAVYILTANNELKFKLGKYDVTQPLIIDPIALRWATWITNNSTGADHAHCIWVDSADGSIYIAARVAGTGLITVNAFQNANAGTGTSMDIILGKYTEPDTIGGPGVRVWQTYLGGSGDDNPYAMEQGFDGNLYVVGYTESSDFPLIYGSAFTGGAPSIDERSQSTDNVFVVKFNTAGTSYKAAVFGGNGNDDPLDLRLTEDGNVIVAGYTTSTNLATLFPGKGASNTNNGGNDVLLFEINFDLSAISWIKNYGGSGDDQANIMVNNKTTGDIFVAGQTKSSNFPTTNPRQAGGLGGSQDGFIQKLAYTGTTIWSSYFKSASSQSTAILCMEFDTAKTHLYFGGLTSGLNSSNISSSGVYDHTYGGGTNDFFVARMDTAQNFNMSTYLGGSGNEVNMMGLNTDLNNDVYIFGYTNSANFPVTADALQSQLNLTGSGSNNDKVFVKLRYDLDSLMYSTYYGGSQDDYDPVGERGIKFFNCRIFTLVTSESNDIPLTQGAITTTRLSSSSIYEPGLVVWANPPDLLGNTVSGNQSICAGTVPSSLTGSVPAYSLANISRNGNISSYPVNYGSAASYEWQSSIDSTTWTDVPGGNTQNLAGSLIGPIYQKTYFRRIIHGDACILAGPAEQIVIVKTFIVPATINNVSCYGLNNGSITANPSNGTTPYRYSWAGGATTSTITNLSPGTYSITVTDAANCSVSAAFAITQPSTALSASSGSGSIACNGGTTTVTVSASGGTSPYAGTGAFTKSAGSYTFIVTDAHGCTASTPITVTQPSGVSASSSLGSASCNGGTATVVVSASGGTSPYSGTGNFTKTAGTYSFTITDNNGCTSTTSITVTQPTAVSASSSSGSIACNGSSTTVTITASGGTAPYSGTGSFTKTAGTYSFIVTDNNGCPATTSITLTQPSAVTASSSSGSIACNGGSTTVTITASGGISPYSGTGSFTKTAGSYSFIVTDHNGCTATTSITVTQPSAVTASSSSGNIACNGGSTSVIITASGGTSPYSGTGSFTKTAGTYSFTVTDHNGCTATTSITVTQPTTVTASSSAGSIACNGGSTTVNVISSGGISPYSGTGSFTKTAGTYSFTVTDANGCTAITSIAVSQPTTITASSLSGSIACNGGSTTVTVASTGGTAPYNGTGSFTKTAGTYSFTVTDANGCIAITSLTVTQPTALTAFSSSGSIACNGGSTTVTVASTGGTAPYNGTGSFTKTAGTYSFTVTDANGCTALTSITVSQPTAVTASSLSGSIACNGGSTTVSVTSSGGTAPYSGTGIFTKTAGTYSFTVSDNNGCTSTTSITVTQPTAVTASSLSGSIACNGGSTTVTVTASGGTAPYSGTGNFTNTAGTYSFIVTDNNGCTATTSITVTQPTVLSSSSGSGSIVCNGGTTTVTITASGGTAPYSGTGNFTKTAGTYSFIVTDSNGCTATTSITVTQITAVTASSSSGIIACNGGSTIITITASGGTAPYSGTGNFTKTAGTYSFIVTDNNGCTATTSITVTDPTSLIASSSSGTIPCNGGSTIVTVAAFGGIPPYTGKGSFIKTAGTYSFTITDNNGCTATTSITITQPTAISASSSSGTIVCNGGSATVTITAVGGTAPYRGTGNFTKTAGTYSFIVTDHNGCTTASSITITQPTTVTASSSSGSVACNGGSTTIMVSASGGTSPYSGTGNFSESAGSYTFVVTDANGCTASTSITVTQPTTLSAISGSGNIACNNGATMVTVSALGGTSPYSGTGNFSETTGSYTFTISDANGCTASTSITVTQPSALSAFSSSGSIACNSGTTTVSVTASGGTTPYNGTGEFTETAGTYTFIVTDANSCIVSTIISITEPTVLSASSSSGAIACNGGSTIITISAYGGTAPYNGTGDFTETTGTYTFIVTDANSCTTSTIITITEPTALSASSSSGNIACNSGSTTVTVTATGGTAPYSGTGAFTETDGTYIFIVTDANGCTASTSITVTQPTTLSAVSSSGSIGCNGGSTSVTITASGGTAPYSGTGAFTETDGIYTFIVTDANGCTASTSITVTQPTTLSAASSSGSIGCNGGSTSVTITASGGTAPYSGTGAFTETDGIYTFIVTDANGCRASTSITVTQPTTLSAASSSGSIGCNGGSTSVTITASGGTAPYSGTGAFTETDGIYTFIVTDANGCTASTSITVTQPTTLSAASSSGSIGCNGGSTSVTITASGGTAPYSGTGAFTETDGTYTFIVTDANSCTASTIVTITEPTALSASSSSGSIACNGGSTTVTISASGGTAPYNGTGDFTETAGTYIYIVTDANGCTSSTIITITEPTTLSASSSSGNIACNSGSTTVTVTATGGTAPYSGTGAFTETAGTYSFIVTDANSCTSSTIITITEPTALSASSSSGNIACNSGSTTVTVTAAGGTAPYSGTGGFTETAGTYSFTVTDANGCTASTIIIITEPESLSASSTSGNTACNGGTTTADVTASGGTAPYSGTGVFSETAGTYTYIVTDANGCTSSTSVTITEPSALTASSISGSISCNGGTTTVTVSASGGTAPYNGTGDFSETAGSYTFIVTDANGCTASTAITITEPSILTASSTSDSIACNGGTTTVTISASGGTAPYNGTGDFSEMAGSYTFIVTDANGCTTSTSITITEPTVLSAYSSSGSIACNGDTTTVTVTSSREIPSYGGTGTFTVTAGCYTYIITDANGCTASTSICISQPSALSASSASGSILCNGGTTTVTVSASGGTDPYNGTGDFSETAGTYTFIVTDSNNCTTSTIITITEPPVLSASSTSGSIACNGETTTATVSASGGTAPYNGIGDFAETAGTYTFVVTDANSCTATTIITITEPTALSASTSSGSIACNGGSTTVTVSASGGTAPYSGTGDFTETAGTYTFIVTDANNCTTSTIIEITEAATLSASSTSGSTACNGGTTTATVSASGGTAPYNGTGVFPETAGSYIFTITDANGCTASTSLTVSQPSALSATSISGNISCNGGTTTATISASGGTAPYNGIGDFMETAGTYTFIVTDANGCTNSTSITITEPSTLSASSTSGSITCNSGTTTATVTASGGMAPYNGTGDFTETAGTYTFIVTDANNCTASTTITITEPDALSASTSSGSIACNGGSTTVTVSASGGTAPYNGTGDFTETAGTYTFLVIDANGCSVSTSITITDPSALSASSTTGSIACNGGTTTATVTASGGTAPYNGTGDFTETAGSYTFMVTDANGCTTSTSITITDPTALSASSLSGSIACNGGTTTATISASGGTAPYNGTGDFTETSGTYTFIVTDANGCTATTIITITEPDALSASTSSGSIACNGGSTTVTISASGGTAPYNGTGDFTETAGTYTFIVTDANGCTASTSITITEPSELSASSTSGSTACNGGTTTATVYAAGGTAPYSGTGVFAETAGSYTFTITDANGCTASTSLTVSEPSAISALSTSGTIGCNGGTTTATVSAAGGTAPYNGTGDFTETAGTYTFTVTDANGCTTSTSITITEPLALSASSTSGSISCNGGTTTVTISAFDGMAQYFGTGDFTETAGTYTFIVTDANGCTASTSITITEPSVLSASSISGSISCNGGTTTATVSASGGTAPYSGTGVFTEAAGSYTFIVTDANGCTASTSLTVNEPSALSAFSSAGTIGCNGGFTTVTITASGGTAPYNGTGDFTETAGTYTFMVTDANGCTSSTSITVTEPPALSAFSTSGIIACNSGTTTVTVSASGGTPPYDGTGSFTMTAGTYSMPVGDINGCVAITNITINEPTALNVSCSANSASGSISVSVNGGTPAYTYLWNNGASTSSVSGLSGGTYSVVVTDAAGCSGACSTSISSSTSCNGFRTETQGGWGAPPHGGNPGVYLHANFAGAFPSGLVVGCGSGFTLTLTTAQAVTDFLPSGSTPRALTSSLTDPAGSYNNVFAAQVVTLALSVGFDLYDPNFSVSTTHLQDLIIASGPFQGWTVAQLLAEAEKALGGCPSSYSFSDLNDAADAINSDYDDGTVNNNFLVCPPPPSCNGFHTETQGGWGAPPHDGNPAFYMTANFAGAFPSGLVVGCGTGYTLTLTSAQAVTDFLPSGSTPRALTASLVDPAGTYSNVFAGQVVTLALNVGFDLYDPNFSTSSAHLQDLIIASGTFQGWTVAQLLAEAEKALGGCPSAYSFSDLNNAADSINSNFDDGIVNNNFLVCSGTPTATCSSSNVSCNGGANGTASVIASNGTPAYSYLWNTGATASSITGLPAGTYSVTVTDAQNATATCSSVVNQPAALSAFSCAGTIACNGGSTTVNVSAAGGTPSYNGTGSFAETAGTYFFTVTDANGCTATTFVTITQPAVLICSIASPSTSPVCSSTDNTLLAQATGGTGSYTYSWSVSGSGWIIIGSTNANPVSYTAGSGTSGNFTVVIRDCHGCCTTCSISISCTTPNDQGCSHGYFKNHTSIWDQTSDAVSACVANDIAAMGSPYSGNGTTASSFATTFGLSAEQMSAVGLSPSLTLDQALNLGGGGFNALSRDAVAALLNTCFVNYPLTATQVLTDVHNAVLANSSQSLESQLGTDNNLICPGDNDAPQNSVSGNLSAIAYPNPAKDMTRVSFNSNAGSQYHIEMIDVLGQKLMMKEGTTVDGMNTIQLNTYQLTKAVYLLNIRVDDQTQVIKLMIQ